MFLVDSHCHLNLLENSDNPDSLQLYLDRASENAVKHFLCVAVDLENHHVLTGLADKYNNVNISVGVHPNHDKDDYITHDRIREKLNHPKIVAIGETGLDYYRSEGDLTWQQDRFRTHIQVGIETQLPIIIHTRNAKKDTIDIMKSEEAGSIGGVMHCFTEDWEMAKKALDLNFYISFSGIVSFKSAHELQEVAKKMPLDRMLIETDCPYLAPVPHRGKQNEPSFVKHVAEAISTLRDESLEEIANKTTENFFHLFSRATKTT